MEIKKKKKKKTPSIIHKKALKLNKKIEKWKEGKNIGFGLRFSLILHCGFHQNNNILLHQHWPLGLQIGLPSS
jgi:hypothetical protein